MKKHYKKSVPLFLAGLWVLQQTIFMNSGSEAWTKEKQTDVPAFRGTAQWVESEKQSETTLRFTPDFPDVQWWARFQDPQLNAYIQQALDANHNLKLAAARVTEARAIARQTLGHEFPQITFNPSFSRQRNSENLFTPSLFQSSTNNPALASFSGNNPATGVFAPGHTFNVYSVPLQASYELDYLLKNRTRSRADLKEAEASEQNRRSILISVISDVGTYYFHLLQADAMVNLQQELIDLHRDYGSLINARREAGLESMISVRDAEMTLSQAQAALPDYQAQQQQAAHKLAVLLGKTPGELPAPPRGTLEKLSLFMDISAGVPSELLRRRPDILAAEAELERSRLLVSASKKDLFPSLTLNGQFGFASTNLNNLFDWGSYIASAGGALAQTVFTGGSKLAAVKVYKSRYSEQLAQYQQTVLNAFQEVEDSLTGLKSHRQTYLDQQVRLEQDREKVSLLQDRFNNGLDPYMTVLQARQQTITIQQALMQTKTNCLIDALSLYKALGGGF